MEAPPGEPSSSSFLCRVAFVDADTGTAIGGDGTILRTTDGGATWILQSRHFYRYLEGIALTDANTGTVVGYSCGQDCRSLILRATDGGDAWREQQVAF
jgi:photosystem II stability/assembly factor-like uncharacterized protein